MQPTLALVTGGLCVGLVVYMATSPQATLERRLVTLAQGPAPAGRTRAPSPLEAARRLLRRAGFTSPESVRAFWLVQALVMALGLALGLAVGPRSVLAAVFVAVGASTLPVLAVQAIGTRRREAVHAAMPDSIDLLTACVEAGLGLDAAIAQLIARQSRSATALNAELTRYLQELQLGVARPEALRNLGARADVEDMRHMVTALIQGEALGVGVSQVLRAQAKHLRLRRRQLAEERAMKAPIKIIFPLAFCIFPSIFIVILGPAVLLTLDRFIGKI